MRALAEIQTVNEQANGAGVWETPNPKHAMDHVANEMGLRYDYLSTHSAYWNLIDSGYYSGKNDHRARAHWARVERLADKIKKLDQ